MPTLPPGYLPEGYIPIEFFSGESGFPIHTIIVKDISDYLGTADADLQRLIDMSRNESYEGPMSASYALFKAADVLFDQVDMQADPEALVLLATHIRRQKTHLQTITHGFLTPTCRWLDNFVRIKTGQGLREIYDEHVDWSPEFLALWQRVML